ncbi:hypothetical protein Leryth_019398 [Lithospermum erythrorhizon]|nr:hypothetical protein Leryth_019398 [Lithospermum erythrorhizon]
MYVKCDHINYAYELFDEMPERDIVAYNAIISGFSRMGYLGRVILLVDKMRFDGIRPDSVTVMGLTQLACFMRDAKLLNVIHGFGVRTGFDRDVAVSNTWIAAYAKCGELGMAEMVFERIDFWFLSVVSWNSLISGYADFGESRKAVELYKRMLVHGYRPELSTILNLLASFVQQEALIVGKSIHSHGIQLGCDSSISLCNTLISMYSKCGGLDLARQVFDSMVEKTCVSWTAMIGGYCEKGGLETALSLFHSMESAGQKPDLVTMVCLISACGQTGSLEIGRQLEQYAFTRGLNHDVMVLNALIDMYSKCGSTSDAQELFRKMPERTVVSWTTIISCYALNGAHSEALSQFHLMLQSDIKPNHITFLAVLQACTHAGLLEKGKEYFDSMKSYDIEPSLDHYACMADLLGRRGKLIEVMNFIKTMPIKPDAGIWGSLLGACKIHRNLEIAEYAACHLFETEPDTAAPYVELANLYADSGKWDAVAAVRAKMKSNRVTKFPGQSLIEVNGKSYTFTVEDRCHSEGSVIYDVLAHLTLQIKDKLYSNCDDDLLWFSIAIGPWT